MFLPYSHRCIRGLLKDKIVILVTHQVQFALEADKLLGLKEVGYMQLIDLIWCVCTVTGSLSLGFSVV